MLVPPGLSDLYRNIREESMAYKPETPFDSIEGALEYVGLLRDALQEARGTIDEDIALADGEGAGRRREALHIVAYKLDRLAHHMAASRRLLNDLRSLRRLLLSEREGASKAMPGQLLEALHVRRSEARDAGA
jgi:hypothetical protein